MASSTRVSGAQVQITGVLDMRSNKIVGLNPNISEYPNAPDDGATKAYVDAQRTAIINALPTLVDNGGF